MARKTSYSLILIIALLSLSIVLPPVFGMRRVNSMSQTWPSRTPTSLVNPTNPPSSGGNNPVTPITPDPTSTTAQNAPEPMPTGDNSSMPAPTENNSAIIPTANTCGIPPTVLALGSIAVREGPGLEYPIIGNLDYLDVRFIVGRAGFTAWWVIQFDQHQQGWVFDQAVQVHGYIGYIPEVNPGSQIEENITSEDNWKPTPLPQCNPTELEDLSNFGESQIIETVISLTGNNSTDDPIATVTDIIAEEESTNEVEQVFTPIDLATPEPQSERSTEIISLLPIVGFALVIVGLALFLLQSLRNK